MNSILLDLGFIKIRWYSFFIFLAFLTASITILKEAKKKKIKDDTITDILFYGMIIGILGARIHFVLFNLDYYLSNPQEIIMVWNGGLAIHGGIICTLLFLILYSKKKKLNTLLITDIIVVGLIIAQAIGRWGNFFNQEAFGRVIELSRLKALHLPKFIIDGMYIDGYYREPTFLYESILNVIGFIVLILLRKNKKLHTGTLTGIYLIWYGTIRFFIEILRSDSLMIGPIKIAMLISLIGVIIGIIILVLSINKKAYYNEDKIIKEN